jgi:mannose-6-phosphate isomerase-like protein (cupin superfamily)
MYTKYFEAIRWLREQEIKVTSRIAFFKLAVGSEVGTHIDVGTYYHTRDRFHLALEGRYLYECGGEEHIIEPGTFFWFDNKKYHSAVNVGTVPRLSLVFDVPHSHHHPNNSKNFK